MSNAVVIDVSHIFEKRKIKRIIREQLSFLGIEDHFQEDCHVSFVNGKPEYTGIIWGRQNGDYVQLGPSFCVTKALTNL